MIEDYASLALSVDKHPIALLNASGKLKHITFANQLAHKAHKTPVRIIGNVVGRQAPGTAGGVTFVTLEDHTGNINVIVWQNTARAQKQPFLSATILEVHGILERSKEGVCHVIAGKLINRNDVFSSLTVKSRDFH